MKIYEKYVFNIFEEAEKLFIEILNEEIFDFIILPIRRAYNLYKIYDMWAAEKRTRNTRTKVYSDVFLESFAAKQAFSEAGKQARVCVFEDSIRFGRRLKDVYEKLNALEVAKVNITIYTLAMNSNFQNIDDWKIKTRSNISLNELNVFADDLLEVFYKGRVVYAHCLPKSKFISLDTQEDAEKYLQKIKKMGFIKEHIDVLRDSYCDYFIYNIEDKKLKEILGEGFANIVELAYIEAYFFLSGKPQLQLLPRVSLRPLYVHTLDQIWEALINSLKHSDKNTSNNDDVAVFFDYIQNESAYVKYTLLEYTLAAMVNCKCVYGNKENQIEYDIDFEDIADHFGDVCHLMLQRFSSLNLHDVILKFDSTIISFPNTDSGYTFSFKKPKENIISHLFSKDSFQDDEECLKYESKGYAAQRHPPVQRYAVSDLKSHFNDNFLCEYSKVLVRGIAANKVFSERDVVGEFLYAGEGAPVCSLRFSKIYYIINKIFESDSKFSSWQRRGKLYYIAVQMAQEMLAQGQGEDFALYVLTPEDITNTEFCKEKVDNLDIDRKTVLELAKKHWIDMYPDTKHWAFEKELFRKAKEIKRVDFRMWNYWSRQKMGQ